jgi:putative phage-type endonuclease
MAKIIDCVQGTEEWLQARTGIITASRVADMLAKTKSGPSASRRNYQAELVVERMTGEPTIGGFVSSAMQWGTEQEPYARASYELQTGNIVREVGFTIHDDLQWAGASPDGLVNLDGAVEIKCPQTATHLELWEGGSIKGSYYAQMQWTMFVNDLAWCDFVSYDPRVKIPQLQLYVKRVPRDQEWIDSAVKEAKDFEHEISVRVEKLKDIARRAA